MSTSRPLSAVSPGAVVLAAAIPVLFLHVAYQPGFGVAFGSVTVNAYLSDFAVLAVVAAAIAAGVRHGWRPLRPGVPLWIAAGLFLAWTLFEVANGRLHASSYSWRTHLVTDAKFAEYALLAPAVPLLVRTARDLLLPLWSLAIWSTLATIAGVTQFFGADVFGGGTAGHRQASFLSSADFAALSAATLLVGVVAIAVPRLRLGSGLAAVATLSGVVGTIVAGAVASVLGLATALVALAVVLLVRREIEPRRLLVVAATAVIVAVGAIAIRGSDLTAFAKFLGASTEPTQQPETKVETYAHRTLLAWIGIEIWKDDPILGVGWEGTLEPANFGPHLAAAHRRFPDESPLAFPSAAPDRRYGVQNVWIQALADLGVIGFALWVATFAAAAWLSLRTALRSGVATGLLGLTWTALLAWLWTAQGYVAGIPLDALTWFAFGVAATTPSTFSDNGAS